VRAIRVTRYKPERRCVIEYDVEVERPGSPPEQVTLIGKVRRLRSGKSGYGLLTSLWEAGFGADAQDGVMVPEPIGILPEFRMWLQRKVSGRVATELLAAPSGDVLARRVAEAVHKLHQAGVPRERKRRHTMADELRVLHACLPCVAQAEPRWDERIERLLNACDRLGLAIPESPSRWIHRDFDGDQVIVDGQRLYLIDFDEYCEGDPALDIGNFLGSLTEYSLRILGDPDALADVGRTMEERFVEISGQVQRAAIRAYAMLTLVRQIYMTTLIPDRRAFTASLMNLCEARLGIGCS
jgi:aminoglycoside phosphotransferase (APT) family kinase protein